MQASHPVDVRIKAKQDEIEALKKELSGMAVPQKPASGDQLDSNRLKQKAVEAAFANRVKEATLGVIRLDYDYPAAPGDIDCPDSYDYDVFYAVVPGLTFQMCQDNAMTPIVEREFKKAIKRLEDKNVSGITGDCGFMMWFQELAREQTSKPVFMSALSQLSGVVAAYDEDEQIIVMTANSKTLEPMLPLIERYCRTDLGKSRFHIIGCEDVPGFEAVALGEKVDTAKVEPEMVKHCLKALKKFPKTRAILMECTELPPYSDAVRHATGLPVFDAITNCDFFINSFRDNKRFGANDWQHEWDGVQEHYQFGQELDDEQRKLVVNQKGLKK